MTVITIFGDRDHKSVHMTGGYSCLHYSIGSRYVDIDILYLYVLSTVYISDVGLLPGQGIPGRGGKSYYPPFYYISILTLSILSIVTNFTMI